MTSTNRYLQPIDTKPNFLYQTKFTGAEIGTATHMILQYYDYQGNGAEDQLEVEIQELIKQKKLNPEIVSSLKKDQIEWFVHSNFAEEFWQKPENLKREIDFSSLISAKTLFKNFSDPNAKILFMVQLMAILSKMMVLFCLTTKLTTLINRIYLNQLN